MDPCLWARAVFCHVGAVQLHLLNVSDFTPTTMKLWISLLVSAWLWLAAWAAYSNAEMRQLLASKANGGVFDIADDLYENYLSGARDYDVMVFMTSDSPQINCLLCRETDPRFRILANSWDRAYPAGYSEGRDIYFFKAEFANSKNLFQQMQLDSIPKIFYFPAQLEGVNPAAWVTNNSQYQFFQGEQQELMKEWVTSITGASFDIYVPLDYSRLIMNACITFAIIMLIRRFRGPLALMFQSPFMWGSLSLVAILLFVGGYMFNQIRNTPFVKESGDNVEYIAPGAQTQYGLETQLLSSLYGLLSLVFVLLVGKVGAIRNAKVQFFAVAIISALLYLLYSVLLFIFAQKHRGYPFQMFQF